MAIKNVTRLEVLICTIHASGLQRVADMRLPRVPGVRYLVSWQMPGDERDVEVALPAALHRDDVTVCRTASAGLSNNRNHAFEHATAPVLLIADDDLRYTAEGLQGVIDTFDADPQLDIAQFRFEGNGGQKYYPDTVADLTHRLPKGLYVTSFELALRRDTVLPRVRFDTRFGIGSGKYLHGEEHIFLLDARCKGLNCRYIPLTVATHTGPTTGQRRYDNPGLAAADGAVIAAEYGIWGALRVPLLAWRRYRQGRAPFAWCLRHALRGFVSNLPDYRRRRP